MRVSRRNADGGTPSWPLAGFFESRILMVPEVWVISTQEVSEPLKVDLRHVGCMRAHLES